MGYVEDHHSAGPNGHHHETDQTADATGELGPDCVAPFFELEILDQLFAVVLTASSGPPRIRPTEVDRFLELEGLDGYRRLGQIAAELPRRVRVGDQVNGPSVIDPEVGLSSPMTCLTSVDLPAPLGPSSP